MTFTTLRLYDWNLELIEPRLWSGHSGRMEQRDLSFSKIKSIEKVTIRRTVRELLDHSLPHRHGWRN
jgi:hypothetical protein